MSSGSSVWAVRIRRSSSIATAAMATNKSMMVERRGTAGHKSGASSVNIHRIYRNTVGPRLVRVGFDRSASRDKRSTGSS